MNRARRLKFWLWMLTGFAAAVATARFLFGLGSTTNLSDAYPWGLWIGFDVMSGVALASGGFIITATVYIFKLERFHSVVRPAVLTAFPGLWSRGDRPAVRPRVALEHLAHDRFLESTLPAV